MALGCWFVFLSIVCGKQNDSHQVLIVTVSLKYGWVHELGLCYLVLACPLVEKKKLRKLENFRFFLSFSCSVISSHPVPPYFFTFLLG